LIAFGRWFNRWSIYINYSYYFFADNEGDGMIMPIQELSKEKYISGLCDLLMI
jgi:hypothetical protein